MRKPLIKDWEGCASRHLPSAPSPETSLGIVSTYGGWDRTDWVSDRIPTLP